MNDKEISKQKIRKLAYSYKLKNKFRDIANIYNLGYTWGMTDEEISLCLQEVGF